MRLLFDHGSAQAHFGAGVFWVRRRAAWPDEEVAVEFWQVKRGGSRWGIVEIIEGTAGLPTTTSSTRLWNGSATCRAKWRICDKLKRTPPTITCQHRVFWRRSTRRS